MSFTRSVWQIVSSEWGMWLAWWKEPRNNLMKKKRAAYKKGSPRTSSILMIFLKQIRQVRKMGSIRDLLGMIPGMGKTIRDLDIDDDAFRHIEVMIGSMTPKERREPRIINGSRRKRIARGSGTSVQEVNRLLKQFSEMSKVMRMMQGGGGRKMVNMMNPMRRNMPGM